MNDQLTIQIPFDLARYAVWQRKAVTRYETNQVIKAIDTWLILKAESRSSFLQDWNKQKQHLLTRCKVSESVFRHRLKVLQSLNLVKYSRSHIWVCSWDQLAVTFEIDVKQRFTIQYNINDKKRIQDWIIAVEIKDNQNRQSYKILQKLNKNPLVKQAVISVLLKAGAERSRINDPEYFLTWYKIVYKDDFVKVSAIHDVLIEIRPDNNRGVKGMATAWKCKNRTTVSYWKKVLQRSGIIDVSKLQIQSQERARNPFCAVLWLPQPKQTLLCLCDSITLLTPWTICKDNTNNTGSSMENLSAA